MTQQPGQQSQPSQQSQQSQKQMTDDRSRLTEKELLYVKDFMSWELLAMKKCRDAADRCEDKEIAALIEETGRRHVRHFNSLLAHLQPG